jgi:hypothetical protein
VEKQEVIDPHDQRISNASERATEWLAAVVIAMCFVILLLTSQGCAAPRYTLADQTAQVSSIGHRMNAAQPALIKVWATGASSIVARWYERALTEVDTDASIFREASRVELNSYDDKWQTFWATMKSFAEAHARWTEAVLVGDLLRIERERASAARAYCAMLSTIPDRVPVELISVEGFVCK